MARKFLRKKGVKRAPYKRRAVKRGRRRLGARSGYSEFMFDDIETNLAKAAVSKAVEHVVKNSPPFQPYKGRSFRGTASIGGRKKSRLTGMMPAGTSATIRQSGGVKIGKPRRSTFREKVMSVSYPPVSFNSKWTFQMDNQPGVVTAASVPILTKELLDPIVGQIYGNLVSDNGAVTSLPTMGANDNVDSQQYAIMIHSYRSNLRMYNSSTNTLRGRVVWYKPVKDMDGQYENYGVHTHSPINTLMLASNQAQSDNQPYTLTGTLFDTVTSGLNYQSNYHHAGWPLVGANTTAGQNINVVATLDPSLVPGSSHVRRFFNKFWRTLKSEDFVLEPGNQFNTSVTMMGKMVSNLYDDADMIHRKNCTVIGVIYCIGQMVFSDLSTDGTISTGSSQLSIMREDTCKVQPRFTKKEARYNLTNPYLGISSANQGKINDESGELQDVYAQDTAT